MKLMNQKFRNYNLQFFAKADGEADSQDDDDQDDDDDDQDDKSKQSDKKQQKTFTQEELDKAIAKRLERERKKAEKEKEKADTDSKKTPEDKAKEESKARDEKVSNLEAKLLCYEHDVAKDCVSDVVALARAYVDEDTDFEEAIEKVIKKYPNFVKSSGKKSSRDKDEDDEEEYDDEDERETRKSWGKRQAGSSKRVDGIEAAFLKKNPGLKID